VTRQVTESKVVERDTCEECGRPLAPSFDDWAPGEECPSLFAQNLSPRIFGCQERTITRLRAALTAKTAELDEARDGYRALDANWLAIHDAAMTAIRDAVGNTDATVPEIVEAIAALTAESAERKRMEQWGAFARETAPFLKRMLLQHIATPATTPSPTHMQHMSWLARLTALLKDPPVTSSERDTDGK